MTVLIRPLDGPTGLWLSLDPPEDREREAKRLRKRAQREPDFGRLHLLAFRDERVVARLHGTVWNGRLALGPPCCASEASDAERGEALSALLGGMKEEALRRPEPVRLVEAEEKPWTEDVETWLGALEQQGFERLLRSRVYARTWEHAEPDAVGDCRPFRSELKPLLLDLHQQVRASTLDRYDNAHRETAEAWFDRMRKEANVFDPGLWWIAFDGGKPVGYVLTCLRTERRYDGLIAWATDIGVVPEHRRRGFARQLFIAALRRLRDTDAQRVLALIDDVNLPSQRLTAALDFEPLPGHVGLYECRL